MSPAVHVIPLTADERAFVLEVLKADGSIAVAPAAAVIEATRPLASGLFEIALTEEDRAPAAQRIDRMNFRRIGVRRFRFTNQPLLPGIADNGIETIYNNEPYAGLIFRGVRTTCKAHALQGMFAAPEFDSDVLPRLLRQSPDSGVFFQTSMYGDGQLSSNVFMLERDFRDLVTLGFYVDDPAARQNFRGNLQWVKAAVAHLVSVGACTTELRRKPTWKYARVYIDWSREMYVAQPARRKPAGFTERLDAADADALDTLGVAA